MTFAGVTHSIHLHFPDTLSTGAADVYDTFIIPEGHLRSTRRQCRTAGRTGLADGRRIHSSLGSIDGRPTITGEDYNPAHPRRYPTVDRPHGCQVGQSPLCRLIRHRCSSRQVGVVRWVGDDAQARSPTEYRSSIWSLEHENYGITDSAKRHIE
jgi:hypothetical protein